MLRRFILALSLALLFGLGQQGAAVHAISHLADQQQQDQQERQDQKLPHLSFCDKCLGFAALDSALGSPSLQFAAAMPARCLFIQSGAATRAVPIHAYAARAPPSLV